MIPPISPDMLSEARRGCPKEIVNLWLHLRPLAGAVGRRYRNVEPEDAEGEAAVVYLEALKSWDPGRGVPFAAFFARRLHQRLWTLARRASRERSREAPRRIEEEEGEIGDLVTLVQDPRAAEPFGEVEIRLLLDRLTPKEKGVLSAFLQGGTLAAFARQEGIARQTAGIYLKRALHKLRRGWDL